MAKRNGFIDRPRKTRAQRPVEERLKDYNEIYLPPAEEHTRSQAERCMDCGIPFCQTSGCPVTNVIPEINAHAAAGRWKEACDLLHSMDNFPEFTGRLCPAPCEPACTLSVNFDAVTIREIEHEVVERGFREGYIVARPPERRTGKRVAVIGSGPAGLVAAQVLNSVGHRVTVFESDERVGGFLRYGVPDFKMEKWVIDRRVKLLEEEGIEFETGVHVGEDLSAKYLRAKFDAVCLCSGARAPRDLPVTGRELDGIHMAIPYLKQSNRRQSGDEAPKDDAESGPGVIDAKGKVVIVLGGGDTGADCVGTANRQGAREAHQFEILPKPPPERDATMPWPDYPMLLRTSTSHEEGCERRWSINTKSFQGKDGHVSALTGCEVEWEKDADGRWQMSEVAGSEFTMDADLVLLALGFVHPVHGRLLDDLGVEYDARGNVEVDAGYMSSVPGVFAAGDVAMGATLIVRAMHAGREMAAAVDKFVVCP